MNLLHRILRGHWPVWIAWRYDFFTWETTCGTCQRLKFLRY